MWLQRDKKEIKIKQTQKSCNGKALLCGCRGIRLPGQRHKISSLGGEICWKEKCLKEKACDKKVVNIYGELAAIFYSGKTFHRKVGLVPHLRYLCSCQQSNSGLFYQLPALNNRTDLD